MKHRTRVSLTAIFVLAVGSIFIMLYWTMRPIQRLKLERQAGLIQNIFSKKQLISSDSKVAKDVPVLLYHGILPGEDDGFNISKSSFERQMKSLYDTGYTAIDMQTYLSFMNENKAIPDKSILITFDDGRKDSYYRADSILAKYNFQAVMFLTSGYSIVEGSNYYVDKHELLEMNNSGRWDIQAHGDYKGTNLIEVGENIEPDHFFGNLQWLKAEKRLETYEEYKERVTQEMATAKQLLSNYLKKDVRTFAFPFGDYAQDNSDKTLSKILIDNAMALYSQAFIQFRKGEPFRSNYPNSGFLSQRIEVNPAMTGEQLVDSLLVSRAKEIPFTAQLNENDGWFVDWGSYTFNSEGMLLESKASNATSTKLHLEGTKQLSDYIVKGEFALKQPDTSVKLSARFINNENYVSCNFSSDGISIESIKQGNLKIISKIKTAKNSSLKRNLSMGVKEQTMVVCSDGLGNQITGNAPDAPVAGGPTIHSWNRQRNSNDVVVKSFSIEKFEN
jgi:peptidoglycan/xylan/chitin deacetylase (PgdA/CDA1 family)